MVHSPEVLLFPWDATVAGGRRTATVRRGAAVDGVMEQPWQPYPTSSPTRATLAIHSASSSPIIPCHVSAAPLLLQLLPSCGRGDRCLSTPSTARPSPR